MPYRRAPAALLIAFLAAPLPACFPRVEHAGLPELTDVAPVSRRAYSVSVADLDHPTAAERAAIGDQLAAPEGLRVQVGLPGTWSPDAAAPKLSALGISGDLLVMGPPSTNAKVVLTFERYRVAEPDCSRLVRRSGMTTSNDRPAFAFGCATYGNLVNMVDNPADLAAPRSFGGANAQAATGAVQRYYDNKVEKLRKTTTANIE